jgi:methyl-accepting chemotaxis protein
VNRRSIQQRLVLLLLVPIAALLYFGSTIVRDRHGEAADMERVSRLAQIAARAGELLHHAQKERGLSAGFLGSRGEAGFAAQLAAERKEADAALAAFRAAVEAMDRAQLGNDLTHGYENVSQALRELPERRGGVDRMTVPVAEVLGYYSELNRRILAMVTDMARESKVTEIANRGTAYVSFMRAKEFAGIERAVLSNTYGAGKFMPGMYARLLTLVALQDDYISSFRVYGGERAWQQYQASMQGDFVEATRTMREAAIASSGGAVPATDPAAWFARQTEKIDAMWKVETWLANDVLTTASALAATARRTFVTTTAAMAIIVLVTLIFGALVVRSIVRPLGRAVDVLGAVADGDFTNRLDVEGRDEVGKMAASLNHAIEAIHQALGDVRQVSGAVATAAQDIFNASEDMATGAQKQAANLEETAATLEEITATVRQNSENAVQANQLAITSRSVAERGGRMVGDAVRAMGEINEASNRIADIIVAIDEIAFQTNLLALNAAVEAARAGEQGKGFAVVATEVRNLAQRSAGAAREIKGLIHDSVRKVESGTSLVNQSGVLLGEIVESVKRVTDIVGEIAEASREQATGIEQVNKAISQMDHVTQDSAAQNEELTGTAQGMAAQAEQLRALVARFRLAVDDRTELASASPLGLAPARESAPAHRARA